MINPALLKAATLALPACPDPVRRAFAMLTAPVQPACGHEAELERLRAEVARLSQALTKALTPANVKPYKPQQTVPCATCGHPMTLRAFNASKGCHACYLTGLRREHEALAAAVAHVNADPKRPARALECWAVVGEMVGKETEAARSLGGRCGLVVLPRKKGE